MKLKHILLTITSLTILTFSYGQSEKEFKKNVKKAEKCYKKGKYEKSAEYLKTILQEYPMNKDAWGFYQEALFQNYRNNYVGGSFRVEVTDSEGEMDSEETENLMKMFNMTLEKPKTDYYNSLLDGVMYCPSMSRAAAVVRMEYADSRYWNDSVVNEKSKAYFKKAEGEFREENFEKAITYYEKAYEEDSDNYKALLYIGDSYYRSEYYGKAAEYFRQAMELKPMLLEPVKYLADAFIEKGKENEALDIIKKSFLVYPDEDMFNKLYFVLDNSSSGDFELNRQWMLRLSKINQVESHMYRIQFFEDQGYFQHYADALEPIKEEYDVTGIKTEDGDESLDKYLEIESWKQMLDATRETDIPSLEYARKMDDKGMLEPYVFISLFNVEFYDQYRHFVDNNKALVEKYINDYLIQPASQVDIEAGD